jgi:acetyl esterase/lipase
LCTRSLTCAAAPVRALLANLLTRNDMDFFQHHHLTGSGPDVTDPRISPLLADNLSGMPPAW